jgi:hypothetical protein
VVVDDEAFIDRHGCQLLPLDLLTVEWSRVLLFTNHLAYKYTTNPNAHFIVTFLVKLLILSAFFRLLSISTSTLAFDRMIPAFVLGAIV